MEQASASRVARLLGAWQADEASSATALRTALADLIEGAHLPSGQMMPTQRALAEALGIARGTVSRAYAGLVASGHLSARQGAGTFVRFGRRGTGDGHGRLASFDEGPATVAIDLSSGALPGGEVVARSMPEIGRLLHEHHLAGDGYHPAGLPELRAAIAATISQSGLPTHSDEVLITAGSQQAVKLIAAAFAGPGSLVVVEDPTYRGALEAFSGGGARLRGVPMSPTGIDPDQLAGAARNADLVYLQAALHNPTGVHTSGRRRSEIAAAMHDQRAMVVDDQSSADLSWTRSGRLPGLERDVDSERLLLVGTLSKLFWGGIRVGWIRGPKATIARLTDMRRGLDLSGSVLDQLAAVLVLPHAEAQQRARREWLASQFSAATTVIGSALPSWRWWLPAGGSGFWVDTGTDAVALAQRALARGVRMTAGPAFSPHEAHGTFLRLPVWHPDGQFAEAMEIVADLIRR
ncbi:MAG: PLP-dependent aminotransferase family protein [Microbacteriaceae bacterium]|uniref:aminotransferase-like domain-containing protein n=1 Tax=Microbacterium sp. JB110 TaxID=2024477 RepID=UPI00097E9861|nr:PLP-dependent aminotransferase family protein [Microbacterium sp. JB110]SJM55260.1 Transcriptional regulator, GntR family domain / Aspartate aminotransferase [Frigoribacterium sp. JB110]